jgi:ribonuclease P protein component
VTGPLKTRPTRLITLKKRGEFLRVRGGAKWSGAAFLMDSRPALKPGPPRFGFTVTKKLAPHAVDRNRMRRRLNEAVRLCQVGHAHDDFDYAVVARAGAKEMPFEQLCRDIKTALARIHRQPSGPAKPSPKAVSP